MPCAFTLLLIIKLILIGKLLSLDLIIRFFKLDPLPDMNTQVFFSPF